MNNESGDEAVDIIGVWMVENFGGEVLGDLVNYLEAQASRAPEDCSYWEERSIVEGAARALGRQALPVVLAGLKSNAPETWIAAINCLIQFNDGVDDETIRAAIERGLQAPKPEHVLGFLKLVALWKPELFEERIWALLSAKSKQVRATAAGALARNSGEAVSRAAKLLEDKKNETPGAPLMLLAASNTTEAH